MEIEKQEWASWTDLIAQYAAESQALGERIAQLQEILKKPCHDHDRKCRTLAMLYKQRTQMGRDIIDMQCHVDGKIPHKWICSPMAYDEA